MIDRICSSLASKDERDIILFSVNKDFKITSWNGGAESFLGFSFHEVLGKTIFETIIPLYNTKPFLSDLKENKTFDFAELEFQTKDKKLLFLNTTLRYLDDAIVFILVSFKDINKRKNLSSFLNPKEAMGVIITLDKNSYIKEFNEQASILTGYNKDDVIDRNFVELFVPSTHKEKVMLSIQEAFRKKDITHIGNFPLICKDKTKKVVYWEYKLYGYKHREQKLFLTSLNQTKETINTQRLNYLSSYDLLTDLPNKTLFLEKLSSSMDKVARSKDLSLMLIMIDIKSFKSINLTLGQKQGDKLLEMIAKRLNSNFRDYDIVARYDGNRFAIVVDDLENDLYSTKIVHRIIELFTKPFDIDGSSIHLDISLGASFYPSDANDIDKLISTTELALTHAKNSFKSDYRFFMPSMFDEVTKKIQMDKAIKEALENDEFSVVYQPKVDVKTQKTIGVEALVRWYHKELKNIPPLDFIPVAEDNGLILEIGKLVLDSAIKDAKEIQKSGWRDFEISVNISSIQLLQSNLLQTITDILKKYSFDAKYLNLELTESIFMDNLEISTKLLQEFRDLGIKISIDDFGTGYSSLSYISKLPINELKIDQSFVKQMSKDKNPIIDAILSMSKALDIKVVAEGVETKEQYNYLKNKNCDMVQGYYFSKPVEIFQIKQTIEEYI